MQLRKCVYGLGMEMMNLLDLTFEEKEQVMQSLKENIPKMTRRQIECWVLYQLGFNQEESGMILGIDQANVSRNLSNFFVILGND